MSDKLFVYGTLLRGESRNHVLASEEFLGEAYVTGADLWDTGWGFPALSLGGENQVWGEVYHIRHAETWRVIDAIEAGLYTRHAVNVTLPNLSPDHRETTADVYVWARGHLAYRILSGRWIDDE